MRRITSLFVIMMTAPALLLAACSSEEPTTESVPAAGSSDAQAQPDIIATLHVRTPIDAQAAGGKLWLLGGPSGVVTEVDPSTNSVVRELRPPHFPTAGAVVDHSLWIVSFADNALMELDVRTDRVGRTIERSPSMPLVEPLGIVAQGQDLWVVDHEPARLLRVDARTGRLLSITSLPGHAAYGPVTAAGRMWVMLSTSGEVVEVSTKTGEVIGEPISVDTGNCVATSVAGDDVWMTGLDSEDADFPCVNAARRLDATTGRLAPQVYGRERSLYEFARAGGDLWATDSSETLYRVDVASGDLVPTMTLPGGHDVANRLRTAYGSLWVLRSNTDQLLRLQTPCRQCPG